MTESSGESRGLQGGNKMTLVLRSLLRYLSFVCAFALGGVPEAVGTTNGQKLTNAFVVDLNGDGKSELLVLASNRHRTDLAQVEYRDPGFVLLNPDSGVPKVVPIKQSDGESPDLWETSPIAYRYGGKTCIAAAFYFRAEPGIVVACTDAQWRWATVKRYPLKP